jgi:hypothetical protein
MTTDPVYDADQHGAAQDAHTSEFDKQEAYYTAVINEALLKTIRTAKHETICLPYGGSNNKIQYSPLAEVVSDTLCYGKPLAALLAVLKDSDCPHVQALRQAIAADYISSHVTWLAELSL